MIALLKKNAGVTAASVGYVVIGMSGIVAIQQIAGHHVTPTIAAPAITDSGKPSPAVSSPTPSPSSPSPSSATTREVVAAPVIAVPVVSRSSGVRPVVPRPRPTSTGKTPTPAPGPTGCTSGKVLAVSLPLGVLPCDTLRVGDAVSVGGTG